ncbi:MAG: hypothetical protein JWR66_2457, partial [Modestobacter sp.]|nr:hypothetical protein [Modestobacter sp.]
GEDDEGETVGAGGLHLAQQERADALPAIQSRVSASVRSVDSQDSAAAREARWTGGDGVGRRGQPNTDAHRTEWRAVVVTGAG